MGNALGLDVSGTMLRVACIVSGYHNNISFSRLKKNHCSASIRGHQYISPDEEMIKYFLQVVPIWGIPRTFCFQNNYQRTEKAICFIIDFENLLQAINTLYMCLNGKEQVIHLTGSRAYELQTIALEKFKETLNLKFIFHKELTCILEAFEFLYSSVPGSCFRYDKTHKSLNSISPEENNYNVLPDNDPQLYPYLLVNLKAGVSFHLVKTVNHSERVGGSTIGGASFMGLIRLLCPSVSSPLDAFLLAQSGDNSSVDMVVADIYGGDYSTIGLKGTTIASTFGKLQSQSQPAYITEKIVPKFYRKSLIRVSSKSTKRSVSFDSLHDLKKRITFKSKLRRLYSSPKRLDACLLDEELFSDHQNNNLARGDFGSYCSDIECCCCGARRWARCETGEDAAAAGFFENCYSIKKTIVNQNQLPTLLTTTDKRIKESDVALSVLTMMSYNVAQLAYFNAVIHKCQKIILVGYYLEMPGYLSSIQHCIDFWSKRTCKISFVRLAPNIGALGASLQGKKSTDLKSQSALSTKLVMDHPIN